MLRAVAPEDGLPRSATAMPPARRTPDRGRLLLIGTPRGGRARLTRALAASGYRTVCVDDGAEALIRLRRGGVTGVLLADELPCIRGQALLPGIRAAWPELLVIFVRQPGETAAGAEGIAKGAHACLVAPVRQSALLRVLREAATIPAASGTRRAVAG